MLVTAQSLKTIAIRLLTPNVATWSGFHLSRTLAFEYTQCFLFVNKKLIETREIAGVGWSVGMGC
jgi:hypothetical protein